VGQVVGVPNLVLDRAEHAESRVPLLPVLEDLVATDRVERTLRKSLERSLIGDAVGVVTNLGEQPCAAEGTGPGERSGCWIGLTRAEFRTTFVQRDEHRRVPTSADETSASSGLEGV
jgi:hypothetical protein